MKGAFEQTRKKGMRRENFHPNSPFKCTKADEERVRKQTQDFEAPFKCKH